MLVWFFLGREDEHWKAVALDYTVVGMGPDPNAAMDSMVGQLGLYLEACRREGRAAGEALRPVPASWRLRYRVRATVSWLLRRVRCADNGREGRVVVPSRPLHC